MNQDLLNLQFLQLSCFKKSDFHVRCFGPVWDEEVIVLYGACGLLEKYFIGEQLNETGKPLHFFVDYDLIIVIIRCLAKIAKCRQPCSL